MRAVPNENAHLWNDLPQVERHRLHPYLIEAHILHLEQTRDMIIAGHNSTLNRLDQQIEALKAALPKQEIKFQYKPRRATTQEKLVNMLRKSP